ncbi:hypothetical protein [Microbulbifer sp. A4B17]|nr:hypothetical protein [Microbulbifer sp. A4B17]
MLFGNLEPEQTLLSQNYILERSYHYDALDRLTQVDGPNLEY